MSKVQIASQLNSLLSQLGGIAASSETQFVTHSARLMSVAFGYKLVELALVSLCVTARTKDLLPEERNAPSQDDLTSYAQLLYDYGLIEHDVYERLVRIDSVRSDLDEEFAFVNKRNPFYDEILNDISQVLQRTESVVNEFCEMGSAVASS